MYNCPNEPVGSQDDSDDDDDDDDGGGRRRRRGGGDGDIDDDGDGDEDDANDVGDDHDDDCNGDADEATILILKSIMAVTLTTTIMLIITSPKLTMLGFSSVGDNNEDSSDVDNKNGRS